jgi:hypothetical protein
MQDEPHRFLRLVRATHSISDLQRTLSELGPVFTGRVDAGEVLTFRKAGQSIPVRVDDLLKQCNTEGFPGDAIGLTEPISDLFSGETGLSTDSSAMEFRVSFGNRQQNIPGPGRGMPIIPDLVKDIEIFREEACRNSAFEASDGLEICARACRSYLFVSVALIDAFIARYCRNLNVVNPERAREISRPNALKEKIKAWMWEYARTSPSSLVCSPEWRDFVELVQRRNETIHAGELVNGCALRDQARVLNLVRTGTGTLLASMRAAAGESRLRFVEQVRALPPVRLVDKPRLQN